MRIMKTLSALTLTLPLTLAFAGCSALVGGAAKGERGPNLALASAGAKANDPIFNDGNLYTQAPTRTPSDPLDPDWRDAEKYTVAEVIFPETTQIHQIVVRSKDLDKPLQSGMWVALEYLVEGEWKTARKWEQGRAPLQPAANIDAEADGVRIRIRRPASFFTSGLGDGGDKGERLIYEVEAYRYISTDPVEAETAEDGG